MIDVAGATLDVGVANEPDENGNILYSLRLIVYGIENEETVSVVADALRKTLLDMDEDLIMVESGESDEKITIN
tara:strand:- start:536 stop:757 length:222 start_codon:yes stop_codon:yes gene_type:complete